MNDVSILIPVYNRERLIAPCIESALRQTVSPIEVVVIDNASTDNTWSVCQEIERENSLVRAMRNETNLGPVRNWKHCIEAARGNYATLLFSDDLMYPTFLEKTRPYLDNPQIGFVFSATHIGQEAGRGHVAYDWQDHPPVFASSEYIRQALTKMSTPLSPGCMLFRLRDLKENLMVNIPSPTLDDFASHGAGPDLLLSLLTAQQYPLVAHVAEPLVLFRKHAGSITESSQPWYLYRRYQQARIWFAASYKNEQVLGELLAGIWLSECKNERRWISPARCAQQYTTHFAWSWPAVARTLMERFSNRWQRV